MILVDTSAWYALLDEDDVNHGHAVDRWHTILDEHALLTHTYVVLETSALVQRRLGMAAVDQLHDGLLPVALLATIDRADPPPSGGRVATSRQPASLPRRRHQLHDHARRGHHDGLGLR